MTTKTIEQAYLLARERYAGLGIDTDRVLGLLASIPVSMHRWDSDHVVTLSAELQAIAQEIIWGGYTDRVRIGLDYFDASINRVAAWVIGVRNMDKVLLLALVTPIELLKAAELAGDFTARLALMEEAKLLPAGAVWDYYCLQQGDPADETWLAEVKHYENEVLARR